MNRKPMYLTIMSQYCNSGKIKGKYKDYDCEVSFCIWSRIYKFFNSMCITYYSGYISYITENLDEIEQDKQSVLIKTILFSLGFRLYLLF